MNAKSAQPAQEKPDAAPTLRFTPLEPKMPEPTELAPGLYELKLYAGDKDRYLMQNNRREFSTRLKVDLPAGYVLTLWPGANMSVLPTLRNRNETAISIDHGSTLVRESTDELKVTLRNYGFGSHHPQNWLLSVLVMVAKPEAVAMQIVKPKAEAEPKEKAA